MWSVYVAWRPQFVYKQEDYWPLLLSTSLAKRSQYLANWERLGGGVGVSEWDFKRPLPAATTTTMTATSAVQEQLPQTQTAVDPQQATPTTTTTTTSLAPSATDTAHHLSPTAATTTTNTPSSSSISSEATLYHETQQQQQHGLDMHALEKGMSGGMVIAEHAAAAVDPIPHQTKQ
ncbi:hypothetical protein QFC22_000022 [Naganishia vaughanmartiniae]|uniref:Uncharacterized protein n=1 Tax=Naganishia vaughanmartiniae TaxID=1424756 RepID=A0ACC2XNW8_9TREE|nr:hypothetical protein QFC22_000022 [Naganishia vaughanmartiniae]